MTKRDPGGAGCLARGGKLAGALALGAVGGWLTYSWLFIDRNRPLAKAINAERRSFTSSTAGEISYYVDKSQSGTPLVLLHSINAAPSAFEVRPLFVHYRDQRPVFALDLPGFGFSQRGDRPYSPQLYAGAIIDFLRDVVGEPADVIALSLSSEFAARAALNQPDLFRSLTVVSPTGLGPTEIDFPEDTIYGVVSVPLWSQPLFDLLVTRPVIRYYTGQSFVGDAPREFIDYAYATAHQPDARFAPLRFLSGALFTPDIRRSVYANLQVPALMIYDRDPNVSFERLPDLLDANPRWQAERLVPSLGLPHWEMLPEMTSVLEGFWSKNQG